MVFGAVFALFYFLIWHFYGSILDYKSTAAEYIIPHLW